MHLGLDLIALLMGVAFVAGVIDAIAGGGGLLTLPALIAAGVPPVLRSGPTSSRAASAPAAR